MYKGSAGIITSRIALGEKQRRRRAVSFTFSTMTDKRHRRWIGGAEEGGGCSRASIKSDRKVSNVT